MQPVLAGRPDEEAEVELRGRLSSVHRSRSHERAVELGRRERLGPGVGGQAEPLQRRARGLEPARLRQLQRARQRLAPVGEGVADQLPQRRRARRDRGGPAAAAPSRTRGRGVNTAGSTVRTSVTSQASWASTLGDAVLAGAGRGAQPLGDLALDHHQPAPQTDGSSSIVRSSTGVATEYGRLATILVGAGSSAARSSRMASPQTRLTLPRLLGERLELGPQALVQLDHVHARGLGGEPLGQRAAAAADLEHDVGGLRARPRARSRRAGSGRPGSSGPGAAVWRSLAARAAV